MRETQGMAKLVHRHGEEVSANTIRSSVRPYLLIVKVCVSINVGLAGEERMSESATPAIKRVTVFMKGAVKWDADRSLVGVTFGELAELEVGAVTPDFEGVIHDNLYLIVLEKGRQLRRVSHNTEEERGRQTCQSKSGVPKQVCCDLPVNQIVEVKFYFKMNQFV